MPDYHLFICGPIDREEDFVAAFYKELYQTPNIHTVGWVDVNSQKFIDIVNNCLAIVYPSCSEGGGGCVINCMHTGLIPIVSYESSVDVSDDYGVVLKENSVEEIKQTLDNISELNPSQLEQMAKNSWNFVREHHTREQFAQVYRETMTKIMLQHGIKNELLTYA